jgi:hypothetical protein
MPPAVVSKETNDIKLGKNNEQKRPRKNEKRPKQSERDNNMESKTAM